MNIVARADLPTERWDAFVEAHPGGWWWHTSHWLAYSLAYNPAAIDHSYAVVDDEGCLCAVVPCVEEAGEIALGGQPSPASLCLGGADVRATLQDWAVGIVRTGGIHLMRLRNHPGAGNAQVFQDPAACDISWSTFVVDLLPELSELWRNIRKSNKPHINRAGRERVIVVIGGRRSGFHIKTAQALHLEDAGRVTRPQRTWDLMGEWLRDGHAVMALITDRAATQAATQYCAFRYVGFAYAIRFKNWSYFASSATLEPDLACALQWALIKALRADGRRYYEVGWDVRPGEENDPKAVGISSFKGGMGGERWPITAVERRFA